MKIKWILPVVLVLLLAPAIFIISGHTKPASVSPLTKGPVQAASTPAPSPTPTPMVFKYDRSTDLSAELEQVNPAVEENDFAPIQKIIDNL